MYAGTSQVALEKGRLMKRSGHAARMYQANAPGPDGLTCPEPYAAGFLAGKYRPYKLFILCFCASRHLKHKLMFAYSCASSLERC